MPTTHTEIRDVALTLIEERGGANAKSWAQHCAARDDTGEFWAAVVREIDRQMAIARPQLMTRMRHEDSPSYRSAMIDAGRGRLLR